jgi:very-short-patch-repair endonuclease
MTKPRTKQAWRLRANMTDAERKLWFHLRNRNFKNLKFRRQVPMRPYVLDFYCLEKNLVIDVDGGHHYQKEQLTYDRRRSTYLKQTGLKILRYPDNEVLKNIDSVLQDIYNNLVKYNTSP